MMSSTSIVTGHCSIHKVNRLTKFLELTGSGEYVCRRDSICSGHAVVSSSASSVAAAGASAHDQQVPTAWTVCHPDDVAFFNARCVVKCALCSAALTSLDISWWKHRTLSAACRSATFKNVEGEGKKVGKLCNICNTVITLPAMDEKCAHRHCIVQKRDRDDQPLLPRDKIFVEGPKPTYYRSGSADQRSDRKPSVDAEIHPAPRREATPSIPEPRPRPSLEGFQGDSRSTPSASTHPTPVPTGPILLSNSIPGIHSSAANMEIPPARSKKPKKALDPTLFTPTNFTLPPEIPRNAGYLIPPHLRPTK